MITKNGSKQILYLDRDSRVDDVIQELINRAVPEWCEHIEAEINNLQGKEAGEFRTIENNFKIGNTELQRLLRFYKGAVIPYFYRQEYGDWEQKIDGACLQDMDKEIKQRIGFVLYDSKGHKTDEPNSTLTFKLAREFNEFLTDIENVCFTDNGYIFPDSDEYKKREKNMGIQGAKEWALNNLKERIMNKYPNREIS
jgi:hypothetical protein